MGLLDDAIREHLELKRRRGGDPAEIERQEREALGPVRRTDDPADAVEAAAPGAKIPDRPHSPEPAAEAAPVAEPEPADAPESPPAPVEPEPSVVEPERVAEAEPSAAEAPDHLAQPTVEFSVEEHLARPAPAPADDPDPDVIAADDDAEDVLEETPDFLQETPEHDRLWFEQKPPRDFDFDG